MPRVTDLGRDVYLRAYEEPPIPWESLELPSLSSPIWEAMCQLLNNKWFGRLWILQEAALARQIRVLYGNHELNWEILGEAIDHCSRLRYHYIDYADRKPLQAFEEPGRQHRVFLTRHLTRRPEQDFGKVSWPIRLSILLGLSDRSLCSDPRDRILGVIGFIAVEAVDKMGLHDLLTTRELYTSVTHFLLSTISPELETWWALFARAISSNKMLGLPSWCPDFHNLSRQTEPLNRLDSTRMLGGKCPYRASRGTKVAEQSGNINELLIRGKVFDTISHVYPQCPPSSQWKAGRTGWERGSNLFLGFRAWERAMAMSVLGEFAISRLPDDPTSVHIPCCNFKGAIPLNSYWQTLIGGGYTRAEGDTPTYKSFYECRSGLDKFALFTGKSTFDFDTKT